MGETGKVLAPGVWCRSRDCREGRTMEHGLDDGCSCHPRDAAAELVLEGAARPEPRITVLRARAMRLAAFACRACGGAAQRMVEYPELFFRCEPCAAGNRWPDLRHRSAR